MGQPAPQPLPRKTLALRPDSWRGQSVQTASLVVDFGFAGERCSAWLREYRGHIATPSQSVVEEPPVHQVR